MRGLGVLVVLAAAVTACGEHADPVSPSSTTLRHADVPAAILQAGCAVGSEIDRATSRSTILARSELPFRFTTPERVPSRNRKGLFRVVRFDAGRAGGTRLLLACIVPVMNSGADIQAAIASVSPSEWDKIAVRLAGLPAERHNVEEAVGTKLRQAVSPKAKLVKRPGQGPDRSNLSCPECPIAPGTLGTITVTAAYNYAVIDHWYLGDIFAHLGEPPMGIALYLEDQAWQQGCNEWNQAMQDYNAMVANIDDAALAAANELYAIADELEQLANQLVSESLSCERVSGKPLCVDFFIMNCSVGAPIGFAGDCRRFKPGATAAQSRIQLYMDPNTLLWEVKFSCTKIVMLGSLPMVTLCDSAQVFNQYTDVSIAPWPEEGPGAWIVNVTFRNNACAYTGTVCPAINAMLIFKPDGSAPGGFRTFWDRDGFPSMGIYRRNASDTGWDIVAEDAQKVFATVNVLRALAGDILSVGSNVPPPPERPEECWEQ